MDINNAKGFNVVCKKDILIGLFISYRCPNLSLLGYI